MKTIKRWPDFEMEPTNDGYSLKSLVRLKKDDKWYVTLVKEPLKINRDIPDSSILSFADALTRLLFSCHAMEIIGIVNTDIIFHDGTNAFELDSDQRSEEERMSELMKNL